MAAARPGHHTAPACRWRCCRLPARARGGGRWLLHGDLALDAQLRPRRRQLARRSRHQFRQRRPARPASASRREPDQLRRARAARDFDPQRLRATLGADFDGDGRVDARIASGWVADSALSRRHRVNTDQLGWLELFSPDIVAPKGRLEGRTALGGTRAHPRLGGDAQLTHSPPKLPALGITLRDGTCAWTRSPTAARGSAAACARARAC